MYSHNIKFHVSTVPLLPNPLNDAMSVGWVSLSLGFPLQPKHQPKHKWQVHKKLFIYWHSTYLYTFWVLPASSAPAISCQSPPKTECQLSGGGLYNLSNFITNFATQIQWCHMVMHWGQLSPVTCQKCQKCQSKLSMLPLKCGSLASSAL